MIPEIGQLYNKCALDNTPDIESTK